jgi:hypothetical protein
MRKSRLLKPTLFIGKTDGKEIYQLYSNSRFFPAASYDGNQERNSFYEEIGDFFIDKLLETSYNNNIISLGTVNGGRINENTKRLEKIPPLENQYVRQLEDLISRKIAYRTQNGLEAVVFPQNIDN